MAKAATVHVKLTETRVFHALLEAAIESTNEATEVLNACLRGEQTGLHEDCPQCSLAEKIARPLRDFFIEHQYEVIGPLTARFMRGEKGPPGGKGVETTMVHCPHGPVPCEECQAAARDIASAKPKGAQGRGAKCYLCKERYATHTGPEGYICEECGIPGCSNCGEPAKSIIEGVAYCDSCWPARVPLHEGASDTPARPYFEKNPHKCVHCNEKATLSYRAAGKRAEICQSCLNDTFAAFRGWDGSVMP